jgi:HPt (histidine-containing phosphotransfer) domain-containing protein
MSDEEIFVKIDPILAELVPEFLARCRQMVAELREAVEAGNLTVARRIGHSLYGSGGSYGFEEIGSLGREIERAARQGDADALRSLAERLDSHVARVRPVFA